MAKKKKNSEETKKGFWNDERLKIISGVLLIFISLFVLIAFISYVFSWQKDQSTIEHQNIIYSPRVENWNGPMGAGLIEFFFDKYGFGIATLGIPFILFITGFRLLKLRLLPLRRTIRIVLLGMIILSITLGYSRPPGK